MISVVVPVLDEEARLPLVLRDLARERLDDAVVVDGGGAGPRPAGDEGRRLHHDDRGLRHQRMLLMDARPWGAEQLWALTREYASKILEIAPGHRTSLQHHVRKTETLLVLEGELVAEVERGGRLERQVLGPGQTLHLPPGTKHRLGSPGGARLVEVSSPELDDVVRHEDDYGRVSCFRQEDLEIVDGP